MKQKISLFAAMNSLILFGVFLGLSAGLVLIGKKLVVPGESANKSLGRAAFVDMVFYSHAILRDFYQI